MPAGCTRLDPCTREQPRQQRASACARLAASGERTRGGDKASALAARPEVERLELMPAGRQKREETVGISPVTGRAASICPGLREPFGGGPVRPCPLAGRAVGVKEQTIG